MSQVFGYAATIISIIGFQLKKQWQIILSQFFSNAFVALSYLFLGVEKMSGGAVCLVGAIQTLTNFFYLKKEKTPPRVLTVIFLAAYVVAAVFTLCIAETVKVPYDLLPLFGSLVFLVGVSIKNSTATRFLFLANMLIWISYDVMATPIATANMVTHLCILMSVVVGIFRYDVKKVKNNI